MNTNVKLGQIAHSCLVCRGQQLHQVQGFESLPRISSDCVPFGSGGKLFVCLDCSLVQKAPDDQWLYEISAIYKGYAAYSVGGGDEQLVMDPNTGSPRKRSEVLLQQLRGLDFLPERLDALDVGCGHGVTLRAMAKEFPHWRLYGHEIDESNLAQLEVIPRFEKLLSGRLDCVEGRFDLVSMIHSLEHFVDPLKTLWSLQKLIEPGGHLFIEVCNLEENPFDLLVADHLTHFTPQTLTYLVARAGFDVVSMESKWVKKELSLLATPTDGVIKTKDAGGDVNVLNTVSRKVQWLNGLVSSAQSVAAQSAKFGIFGTSIAGTWLGAILHDKVEFFVDEDPSRIGREFMGKPILGPNALPDGANVYLALAPVLAEAIVHRLTSADPRARYLLPG